MKNFNKKQNKYQITPILTNYTQDELNNLE